MNIKFLTRVKFACVAVLLLAALSAHAQFSASLSGTVMDSTQAVIPGATVVLTNDATKATQTVVSSSAGTYQFNELPPGSYSIKVTFKGFQQSSVSNVAIAAETPRTLDLTLQTGQDTQTVNVNADLVPVLQTSDASIGSTIDSAEIQRLPAVGANPYELLRTAPGITGDAARAGNGTANFLPNGQGPGGSSSGIYQTENQTQISADGQRVTDNNYTIDGVSVDSLSHGGSAVVTPNTEAIAALTVVSTSYDAADGRNSGAQIKAITKNGTNDLHGSLFFLYDEPGLNSYNKWGGPSNGPRLRVSNKQRTYAASIGGPLVKNKLFLFSSYQGFGQGNNGTSLVWVDTTQYRSLVESTRPNSVSAQIFAAPGIQPRITSVINRGCLDYSSNQGMYPAQTVTSGLWCQSVTGGIDIGSPTAGGSSQIGIYPLETRPAGKASPEEVGGGLDGVPDLQFVSLSVPGHSRGNQYNGRVDYNLTSNDLIAGSVYFTKLDSYGSANGNSRPMGDNAFKPLNSAGTLIYIHTFSPSVINELRGNFTRFYDNGVKDGGGVINFGIPEVHTEGLPFNSIQWGLPQGIGRFFAQNTYEVRDTVSKTWNSQVFHIGVELRREQDNDNIVASNVRPVYSFRGLWNVANGTPIFEGIDANPNTGGPPTIANHLRSEYYAGFLQDDWKATPTLTINLGLRWELFTPLRNKDFKMNYPVLGAPGRELVDIKLTPHDRFWNTQYGNFGPKFGFAWNPALMASKMVLRGGFALAYNHLDVALFNVAQLDDGPGLANFGLCCGTASDFFGTPFAGNTITYVLGTSNSATSYPINPALATGVGANGYPKPFNGANPNTEVYGAFPNTRQPYSYLFSLETQYQLPAQMTATIGYGGSIGRHYARLVLQNFLYNTSVTTGGVTTNVPGSVFFAQTDSNTSYNALNVRLERRMRNNFTAAVNYTYSKSLDQVSNGDQSNALANQTNPANNATEWGPSDYDTQQRVNITGLYELPNIHTGGELLKAAVNGWQINGILTYHTGFPWTPITNNLNSVPNNPTSATVNPVRPLAYFGGAGNSCSSSAFKSGSNFPGGGTKFFSTTLPTGKTYTPGIGRNSFRGPCYLDVDMSVAKEVRFEALSHTALLRFQANAYNVFNILSLQPIVNGNNGGPANISSANFGEAPGANAGRVLEFLARFQF
jgi:Carboxypeptidase regulatory-like domain/TonB dependent receptor